MYIIRRFFEYLEEEPPPAAENSHVVQIPSLAAKSSYPDRRRLVCAMRSKMLGMRPHSHGSTEETPPCIFKIPKGKAGLYPWFYYPEIVSIGPYHHYGHRNLYEAEENKWRFLKALFSRVVVGEWGLGACIDRISGMEQKIRDSYHGDIRCDRDQLVQMMVLDGCFIIELLLRVTGSVYSDPNDFIIGKRWSLVILMKDLIKVENQIPFFVLKELFRILKVDHAVNHEIQIESLPRLLLLFFNKAFGIPEYADMGRHHLPNVSHILDILRSSLVPTDSVQPRTHSRFRNGTAAVRRRVCVMPKNIHCASILRKKGIKIKPRGFLGLSDIKFREGVLWIPSLVLDDFTFSALLNCIAYEQCYTGVHHKPMHITAFAAILDSLVNTAEDVRLLRDSNVIEHFYGTDEEVAQLCNNLGKVFPLDPGMDLWGVFEEINSFCKNPRNTYWASFKQTYFGTPWIFFSALAAIILLLLTVAQTVFSAFGYFHI